MAVRFNRFEEVAAEANDLPSPAGLRQAEVDALVQEANSLALQQNFEKLSEYHREHPFDVIGMHEFVASGMNEESSSSTFTVSDIVAVANQVAEQGFQSDTIIMHPDTFADIVGLAEDDWEATNED